MRVFRLPPQDYEALKRAGAKAIFPPGTAIAEAAEAPPVRARESGGGIIRQEIDATIHL